MDGEGGGRGEVGVGGFGGRWEGVLPEEEAEPGFECGEVGGGEGGEGEGEGGDALWDCELFIVDVFDSRIIWTGA